MESPLGWRNPELWNARASRLKLHRAIETSAALRVASAQARTTREGQRLLQRRTTLQAAVQHLTDTSSEEEIDAVTQGILRYYRDEGELNRKAGGL